MTTDLIKVAEDSARGGFFLVSGSFIATIISAVTVIFIGRFLGPELYGQYALSLVMPGMLFLFADLGISTGVIKYSASLRAEGKIGHAAKIIKHAITLKAATGLMFFLLNFALADFIAAVLLNRPDLGFYVRVASISIIFQVLISVATSAYLGLDRTHYSALTTNIQAISKAIISFALVLLGFSVAGAVLGHVAGFIIGGVFGISILLLVLRKFPKNSVDDVGFTESLKTLMSYGIPLYVSGILMGFVHPYQNFILAILASDVDIGNLKAAVNFVALITVVSAAITTALFPAFSKLDSAIKDGTTTFFKFANKYTTLLVVPIATLLITFSKEIVQIVYGSTYQTAALFLSIYCLLFFLVGLGYLTLTSLFNGLGETRITFKISLITLLLILTLSPLLITAYGVPGSLAALICAHATSTCYGMYVAKRNFKIEFDTKSLIKIYLVGAGSTVPSLLLLQVSTLPRLVNVLVGGMLYLAIYVTLAPTTKIVNNSELETVTEIVQKIKPLTPIIKPLIWYQKKILNRQESPTKSS
jgi:O-antigen/teichoic acid export membrane protein